jgi:hypothetical protein
MTNIGARRQAALDLIERDDKNQPPAGPAPTRSCQHALITLVETLQLLAEGVDRWARAHEHHSDEEHARREEFARYLEEEEQRAKLRAEGDAAGDAS